MTGLKELRRNAPHSHAFTILPEARSLAQMVGMEEIVHGCPGQHCAFDSNTLFVLERHKTM